MLNQIKILLYYFVLLLRGVNLNILNIKKRDCLLLTEYCAIFDFNI